MIIQNNPHISQAAPAATPTRAAASAVESVPVAYETTPAAPPSLEEVKQAVEAINHAMRQSNRDLEFQVDSDTRKTVVKMVDTSTGELIRQFPTETTLAISRGIEQFQQGLLLTRKA